MDEFERNHLLNQTVPRHWTLAQAASQLPPPGTHPRSAAVYQHGSLLLKLFAPHSNDPQQPHARDEIYVVGRGVGEFVFGGERQAFGPHDVLFAAAGVEHRFENFSGDLAVWVFFYGPEGGEVDRG